MSEGGRKRRGGRKEGRGRQRRERGGRVDYYKLVQIPVFKKKINHKFFVNCVQCSVLGT